MRTGWGRRYRSESGIGKSLTVSFVTRENVPKVHVLALGDSYRLDGAYPPCQIKKTPGETSESFHTSRYRTFSTKMTDRFRLDGPGVGDVGGVRGVGGCRGRLGPEKYTAGTLEGDRVDRRVCDFPTSHCPAVDLRLQISGLCLCREVRRRWSPFSPVVGWGSGPRVV